MPVAVGSTFTASILGNSYATAIMPDGKEWMTENLVWDSCGQWYGGGAENDGDGRFYNWADCALIISELAATESESGWRVCTYADSWGLVNACKDPLGLYPIVPTLAQPHARWDADGRPTIATNTTGFNAFPQGWKSGYSGEWYPKMYGFPGWKIMTIPANGYATGSGQFSMSKGSDGNISAVGGPVDGARSYFLNSRYPVRLVRDPLPDVATPALSLSSGYSAGPVTVTINCETAGASFHYTTDGSTPTEASPVLNGGIVLGSWISPAITLKVKASASGYRSSEVVSATYRFTAQAPMVSLQMKPESGYFFSEAESRKPRVLGASGKGIFAGTIQWELIDEEWPLFVEWWEAKQKGVQPFDIYCCTGDHATLHTFQAVGPYEVVRDTGVRKVTLPVKLTMRPTGLYSGWGSFLGGPPVAYPVIVPMPQWGFQREEAAVFLSTTGAPTAARPVATRGELLSLEWKALTGMQFDVLVDWWSTYLGQGRRKFTISLPGETGPLLCQLVEDPAFTVEGVHFRGSMKVFAAPVRTLAPLPTKV